MFGLGRILLRLSMRPWRAALSQSFSVLAVGVLLLLSGILYWFQSGLKPVLHRLRAEQVVTVYLKANTPETTDQALATVDSIKMLSGAQAIRESDLEWVDSVKFLEKIKKTDHELYEELNVLGDEIPSLVPRYVSLTGLVNDRFINELKSLEGVESVETSKDRNRAAVGAFSTLRWISRVLLVGVLFSLLIGLIHLSRSNSYLQRDSILILKSWGADESIARLPSVLSGFSVGFLGGLLAMIGWWSLHHWVVAKTLTLSPFLSEMTAPALYVGFIFIILGSVLGSIAGWLGVVQPHA